MDDCEEDLWATVNALGRDTEAKLRIARSVAEEAQREIRWQSKNGTAAGKERAEKEAWAAWRVCQRLENEAQQD